MQLYKLACNLKTKNLIFKTNKIQKINFNIMTDFFLKLLESKLVSIFFYSALLELGISCLLPLTYGIFKPFRVCGYVFLYLNLNFIIKLFKASI